jgi:hypothetical protein
VPEKAKSGAREAGAALEAGHLDLRLRAVTSFRGKLAAIKTAVHGSAGIFLRIEDEAGLTKLPAYLNTSVRKN